jgi:hypothetical protein
MRFLLAGNDIIREYTILKCFCQIYHYTQRGLSIFIFCSHTVKHRVSLPFTGELGIL